MEIKRNYPLKKLNSFGIDVYANYFVEINSENDIIDFINNDELKNKEILILGGGNNILFTKDFAGVVIYLNIKYKNIESETEEHAIIKAGAAEDWDSFVKWTVNKYFYGLENLSSIPGTVGASPVQNIGAYGTEVKDSIIKVNAISLKTGEYITFSNSECEFSYRNSVFKEKYKNQYIITYVYFKLNKRASFKIQYGDIIKELKNFSELNIKTLRQTIIKIRDAKLPKPEEIPNAGSFFKNPVVNKEKLNKLKLEFPEIVSYKIDNDNYKLAAGWLIDFAGWKGENLNNVGVHEKQALVLININNARGSEILYLADVISKSISLKFGIELEYEVNIV